MRKVLSFVLVLALVLGSFSMAFGLTDVAGDAKEEAINVASDLGIIEGFPDGTFKPDQAVNRAEFAAMMTRALGIPESALAAYTSTSFKDVAGYGWAVKYLAFCESKGIMEGDGMGNVMPGRTISVNEAITMVARALGYTNNSSVLVGVWPANYVSLGQDLGLYSKLAAAATVDRANAAQVIYNALTVQKVQVNADGQTNGITTNVPAPLTVVTMLNSGLECTASLTPVVIYGDEDSLINLKPYVGDYAWTYSNSDLEIVAISKVESVAITGSFDAATNVTVRTSYAGVVFENLDEVEYTFSLAVGATIPGANETFLNGDKAGLVGTGDTAATTDVVTLNVKVNGKTISEVYSVEQWTADAQKKVKAADLTAITQNQTLLGQDFALDDDDEIDTASFELVGVNTLSDIEAGDVVYVYSDTTPEISRVEVGKATVDGDVTKANSDGSFVVGGGTYENATLPGGAPQDAPTQLNAGNVGDTVTLFLDSNGEVYDIDVTATSPDMYGVVLTTAAGIDPQIKLFVSDGTTQVYTPDNAAASTSITAIAATGGMIKFNLSKDGQIKDMSLGLAAKPSNAPTSMVAISNSVVSVGGVSRVVADDAVVFTLTAGGDWKVKTMSDVEKDPTVPITGAVYAYVHGTDLDVRALVVPVASANAGADEVYGVINKLETTVNADGDVVYLLTGYADGEAISTLTYDNTAANYTPVAIKSSFVTSGAIDLVLIEYNADGTINTAVVDAGATMVSGPAIGTASSTKFTIGTTNYAVDDSTVYYLYDATKGSFSPFAGTILAGYKVKAYDVDSTADGIYDYVLVQK